ncbi:MAG: peptidase M75 [Bacteroidaceae bacterium]|nr:peptidase M75 [Bacteroidaceae bacterium]
MKKNLLYTGLLLMGIMGLASCSDDDDNGTDIGSKDPANIEYTSEVAASWHNYANNVAALLKSDATELYNAWTTSYNGGEAYATTFKNHSGGDYTSAINCVSQIIDGCATIANEVGTAKIGEPYDFWMSGNTTQALYAVESWYSWHSRDDYTNNIWSIRNAYYGTLDGTIADHSISTFVKSHDEALNTKVIAAINDAADAIQAIPQPFRSNINSSETVVAMDACDALDKVFANDLTSFINNHDDEEAYSKIATNYVDVVVLPTYKNLMDKNTALYNSVVALSKNPSNLAFAKACEAWLEAREPWEQSEAFLFGPVDALGLDPNMDSWPLDQAAIVNILKSGNFNDINWGDGDSDEAIEAAQNVRGFHTLEFLLFKDGQPRKAE